MSKYLVNGNEVVEKGKIIDFIDGKHRQDTPEEYVRQQIEKSIIKEYLYLQENCQVEFTIKMEVPQNVQIL